MAGVNIKDVALQAGVSVGTVSNVLNRPDVVRPATRARVEAAIVELGFVPNASARQLVVGQSRTLAYVVLDAANPFFTDVAAGIEEVTNAHDLTLFLCNSGQSAMREDATLARLTELRVRGVLVTPVDGANPRLEQLRSMDVPVVFVDRLPETAGAWCSVSVDDVAGGSMAARHLLDRGHRRLAFVGGPTSVRQVADRLSGARQAVDGAEGGSTDYTLTHLDTDGLTMADGRRAGERLLGLGSDARPTGVSCANDLVALGLLQCLLSHGVDVPGDVAVVGYDDIEFAAGAVVPLTSVAQPRRALGRAAAELLLDEAESDDHVHRQRVFLPELVARASTVGPQR